MFLVIYYFSAYLTTVCLGLLTYNYVTTKFFFSEDLKGQIIVRYNNKNNKSYIIYFFYFYYLYFKIMIRQTQLGFGQCDEMINIECVTAFE